MKKLAVLALAAGALLTLGSAVRADTLQIFTFSEDPAGTGHPDQREITYTAGGNLTSPHATSDGTNLAPGLAGSDFLGHTYADLSLTLQLFPSNGAANGTSASSQITQALGAGTFQFTDHSGTNILSGTVTDALITRVKAGVGSGSVLSGVINYTGGVIFNEFSSHTPTLISPGSFSFSLNNFTTGTYGTTNVGGTNYMSTFSADLTGNLSATIAPLPSVASTGLGMFVGLGALSVFRRRRATSIA